jgi:hypothetical protein
MSNVDLSRLVGGKSYIVPCHIFNNGFKFSSFVLADTRANSLVLICEPDNLTRHAPTRTKEWIPVHII